MITCAYEYGGPTFTFYRVIGEVGDESGCFRHLLGFGVEGGWAVVLLNAECAVFGYLNAIEEGCVSLVLF